MYDMEEYRNHIRNFYLDLEELPGPVIRTKEELYDALCSLDGKASYDENTAGSMKRIIIWTAPIPAEKW